ncbi:TerB family tellurite resistance protein [Sulfitobacter sp. F26169L]|uniref:tellurite resistance TerB family protein n=1 Tax=Sulfitobacter sp. F26169L TaxID=2996015 RepID=UPI0022609DE3|nr:TerB family tellurite resistance protein [Sulfitobacter sp. F26169L]MCX7564886.1 TerB family tellurite resistance protein [Sulfitobacter sp. F26169L]
MLELLFPRRVRTPEPLPQPNAQLALGALLVRVALANRQYLAAEVAQIDRVLSATFDLKPLDAAKLRAECEALERHAPGTPEFTKILRDEVDYAERKALADAMWAVAMADGRRDADEEMQLLAIETALGLSDADIAAARKNALGKL